jgi:hypothetical protein
MRGLPTYCEQRGLLVELWFSSPNGDSSDSHILQMCCETTQQASTCALLGISSSRMSTKLLLRE